MSESSTVLSFFRVAKRYPPGDGEYRTAQDRSGDPTSESSPEVKACWVGLSAYDTEEGARQQSLKMRGRLGRLIVRYDIPNDGAVTWRKSFGPGHYTLFGDKGELKRYLTDFVVEVS